MDTPILSPSPSLCLSVCVWPWGEVVIVSANLIKHHDIRMLAYLFDNLYPCNFEKNIFLYVNKMLNFETLLWTHPGHRNYSMNKSETALHEHASIFIHYLYTEFMKRKIFIYFFYITNY